MAKYINKGNVDPTTRLFVGMDEVSCNKVE